MKKLTRNLIIVLMFASTLTYGQIKDIGNFMAGGVEDAENLFQEYLTPLGNSFGASLTSGWYNTAKPHKPLGFDLTFTFNLAFVPDEDLTYMLDDIEFSEVPSVLSVNATGQAPTFSGKRDPGPQIQYIEQVSGNNEVLASYNAPKGTGVSFIGVPMIQLGVGLIKDTEIVGRYMPTVSLGNVGELGVWGVGLKHSLKQWIPGIKMLPVFNMSLFGGYTQMNSSAGISITHLDLDMDDPTTTPDYDNQSMDLTVSSFTAALLVSANLPVVCFYGGAGIATTKSELALKGNYPYLAVNGNDVQTQVVTDPFTISIENKDGAVMNPRLNAGVRFKFAVITLHFDYTYANYSLATAGLGISFR